MTTLPHLNLSVSFILSSHNRREVLLATLRRLRACGLAGDAYEVIVIDNASADGSADAIATAFPDVRLIRCSENRGACAKNLGIAKARGRYVVFLDDDSFPRPGDVARMVRHFQADPNLGAAVFTVVLPDGGEECSAYPEVFIGCGTGFRRRALMEAGGLPDDFFMQAEEYDLSLRLLDCGWTIRRFDDLVAHHLKTPRSRSHWRTMRLDVRNNLCVALRRVPDRWRWRLAGDWLRRYWLIASANRRRGAFLLGLAQGLARAVTSESSYDPVQEDVFERFARFDQIEAALREQLAGARRVLLVDLGKNILAYHQAARRLGLEIVAIADNRLAGRRYRGIPILTDAQARRLNYDLAIIANSSPVHARQRLAQWNRPLEKNPGPGSLKRAPDPRPVIDPLNQADPSPDEGRRLRLGPDFSASGRAASEFHRIVARSA